jgi:hypothetical protein
MPQPPDDPEARELLAALQSLAESGLSFRGPFATSFGELVMVEQNILRRSELIDLHRKGELTRAGIGKLLARHKGQSGG